VPRNHVAFLDEESEPPRAETIELVTVSDDEGAVAVDSDMLTDSDADDDNDDAAAKAASVHDLSNLRRLRACVCACVVSANFTRIRTVPSTRPNRSRARRRSAAALERRQRARPLLQSELVCACDGVGHASRVRTAQSV
jgi:hypothetical protein